MEQTKLIETIVLSDILAPGSEPESGIFTRMWHGMFDDEEPIFPWLTLQFAISLDKVYYLSHSGQKLISRTYQTLREYYKSQDESTYESMARGQLCAMLIDKFANSWNRIYNALVESEYKPLDNYNMVQEETPDITHTKNVKQNVTTKNDGYGFNSTSAVPQTESNISGDAEENEEINTESGKRTLTRSGNIGVTTSQQMLQSELDLRSQNHFMDIIMNDTDSILCLLAY